MDFETFKAELDRVKEFNADEDYEVFDNLVDTITGKEGVEWLNCLLDAVCVEDDYGPYEGLYNAIWSFPQEMVGKRLGEYLPSFQQRMSFAPSQVWRFYIPIHQKPESQNAFIAETLKWNEAEREIGLNALISWSRHSAKEEADWMPILQALDYTIPEPASMEQIPAHWPEELTKRLNVWRELPPDDTSKKVFWSGGKATDEARWKQELPYLIEALALTHGIKWRDIKVWLNPLSTFALSLFPDFIAALAGVSPDIRGKALENIKQVRPDMYEKLKEKLAQF